MTDCGVIARKLELPDTYRRISLTFRHSFPRKQILAAFADLIRNHLPNTVREI